MIWPLDVLWVFGCVLEQGRRVIFCPVFAMCSYIRFLNTFPGLVLLLCIWPTCVSYFLWLILTVLIKVSPLSWLRVVSPLAHFQQRCGLGRSHLILQNRPREGLVQEAWHSPLGALPPPWGSSHFSFCEFINLCFPGSPFPLPLSVMLLLTSETTRGSLDGTNAPLLFPAGHCVKGFGGGRNGSN